MSEHLQFDPAAMDPHAVHRLLVGSVVPRPIGWVSTVSAAGVANLEPFSFFTVVCVAPPMISLTIADRARHHRTDEQPIDRARVHGGGIELQVLGHLVRAF